MGLSRLGSDWVPVIEAAFRRIAVDPAEGAPYSTSLTSVGPRLAAYLDEVVDWNRRIDLTAARSAEELVDITVADAAVIAGATEDAGTLVDVGSGAGAPGLVLAVLLPHTSVTLVEPRNKRVAFLRSVIGKLELSNVKVERARSDRMPDASFDVAVSRATLSPDAWLVEGARLARRWVWVLLAEDDPPAHPSARLDLDVRYEWPLTHKRRRGARFTTVAG
jgi:16S rRNA (guanine527-N7)-methyltransferase